MEIITSWNGGKADALRQALRMTKDSFADFLGASPRNVANWRQRPDMVPLSAMQRALDKALADASEDAKARFALLIHGPSTAVHQDGGTLLRIPLDSMTSHVWTRDDSHILSATFDQALTDATIDDIERLAHVWLISEPPQTIELAHGRRISETLIGAVEHRVTSDKAGRRLHNRTNKPRACLRQSCVQRPDSWPMPN